MIELLIGVLLEGLKLKNTKESLKYIDEVIRLQRDWLYQYNLPREKRNNESLDYIEGQIFLISKAFTKMKVDK